MSCYLKFTYQNLRDNCKQIYCEFFDLTHATIRISTDLDLRKIFIATGLESRLFA